MALLLILTPEPPNAAIFYKAALQFITYHLPFTAFNRKIAHSDAPYSVESMSTVSDTPLPTHDTALNASCETIPGVGPTIAGKLARCGIKSIKDLLFYLPYRYQDRTRITPIRDIRAHDWVVLHVKICKSEVKYGKRKMLYCFAEDKTGVIRLRFFHFNPTQVKQFADNPQIRVFGEVRAFSNHLEMIHPEYQLLTADEHCPVEETLTPIYSTTQGLGQSRLRQLVYYALAHYNAAITQLEWMDAHELSHNGFYPLADALVFLHNPPPDCPIDAVVNGNHPAIKRLAYDELLAQRLSLQFARQERRDTHAPILVKKDTWHARFTALLPFTLTNAQQRVAEDIAQDLSQSTPMLRLVQGDVGAGKTVIAALAALQAIASGFQVAFMAPTDILSEQHAQTLAQWFAKLEIKVLRLSGKMKKSERRKTMDALINHECSIVVGTHALFQQEVCFKKLGLIIIDEQHRFGVEQRLKLKQKGENETLIPHQLLMTATPIPRTLAMTQLAHLDISVLNELPPGRTPVMTAVINQEKRQIIIERLQAAIIQGRQAYWVCTLIEESEKLQCMAAVETAKILQAQLSGVEVGLIHGRMPALEKETIMRAFKAGEINLLVATTVIEVGVDVANASLMIIENAERLGLSQLHQLRGRVGRGNSQSHCLLLYQPPLSLVGQERLSIMRQTSDGFIIAGKDMSLRGSGDVLGARQTGYHSYRIADLRRDAYMLPQVAKKSVELVAKKPDLAKQIAKLWRGEFEQFLQG